MNKISVFRQVWSLFIVIYSVVACSPSGNGQPLGADEATRLSTTLTPTITQTSTPTNPPSPSLTTTCTPSPTSDPTPLLLVESGTPLPTAFPPISVANAAQVSALLEWREKNITDLCWTPDGRILAVSDSTLIKFYENVSFQLRRTLYPRNEGVINLEFSPNGTWLVAGIRRGKQETGYASSLETWLGPDWQPLGLLYGSGQALTGMDFSPNGWYFATAYASAQYSQNSVDIWNVTTWTISETLKTGTVLDVAFSTDGKMIASSPDRYAIRIWDLDAGEWVYTFHTSFTGAVTRLLFSPDGVTLATGHYDGAIRLWDLRSGELALLIESKEVIESLAFSPDSRILASGGSYENKNVRLWSAFSGELLNTLDGHNHGVSHLLFSPDSKYLVSASYDGVVRVWGIRP